MMVKGKAVEVEVVAVVAPAVVGGRRQWLATCRRENLIATVVEAAMGTIVIVVTLAVIVMEAGLVMVSPQL